MPAGDRFAGDMDFTTKALCGFCVHKHPGAVTCGAYTTGIPPEFLSGKKQHTSEVDGDNGIVFELDEGKRSIAEALTGQKL